RDDRVSGMLDGSGLSLNQYRLVLYSRFADEVGAAASDYIRTERQRLDDPTMHVPITLTHVEGVTATALTTVLPPQPGQPAWTPPEQGPPNEFVEMAAGILRGGRNMRHASTTTQDDFAEMMRQAHRQFVLLRPQAATTMGEPRSAGRRESREWTGWLLGAF